jgi:outer membrane protein
MIKSITLLTFIVLIFNPCIVDADIAVEFRTAAFFPCEDRFRDIYGDVNPSYQIEATYGLCNCWKLFANIDEFYQTGRVKYCCKSSLNILTTSFGPKYVYPLWSCVDIYGGVGLSLALKSGINYYFYRNFFLDLFVDYNYQPAFDQCVDIGGVKTGLGIGYLF